MRGICTTSKDVQEMRRLRNEGRTNFEIANLMNISYRTVIRNIGKQPSRKDLYSLATKINSKGQRLCVNSIITKLAGKYVNFEIDQSGKVIVVLSKTDDEIGVMSAEELRVIGEEFIEAANYTENRNSKPFNVSFG